MHDTITVGIPVMAILFGILFNQRGLDRLECRFDRLEKRIDVIQSDLSRFYQILGGQGGKIEMLQKKYPQ
ncbi:MAG: hypothetical protein ABR910_13625 [Acidobacteriaceae bacterium]|jgi:hypothetical protein